MAGNQARLPSGSPEDQDIGGGSSGAEPPGGWEAGAETARRRVAPAGKGKRPAQRPAAHRAAPAGAGVGRPRLPPPLAPASNSGSRTHNTPTFSSRACRTLIMKLESGRPLSVDSVNACARRQELFSEPEKSVSAGTPTASRQSASMRSAPVVMKASRL